MPGALLGRAQLHVALLEVGLNPKLEAIVVINHALAAAYTHKAVMVSNHVHIVLIFIQLSLVI